MWFTWTTFCLSIFIKVVSLETEDWSYNVWNMNHIISCKRKNVVHEKCNFSNLWFTSKQKMNHFPSKYLWRNGIVEKAKYWTLNLEYEPPSWNEFGSLKLYSFEKWPFVIHILNWHMMQNMEKEIKYIRRRSARKYLPALPDNYFF